MELQLRKLRRAHDLTQGELAEKIDVTLRVVSSWEREETQMPLADAARIADVFGCTLDELAGREWPRPSYADPRQAVLNAHYETFNDEARSDVLKMVERMAHDPNVVRLQARGAR